MNHALGQVLLPAPLGLALTDGRVLGSSARVLDYQKKQFVDSWTAPIGERGPRSEVCEELTVQLLDEPSGVRFDLVARAYDKGVALRYVIRDIPGGGTLTLAGEATCFKLPPGTQVYVSRDEGEYQRVAPGAVAPPAWPKLSADADQQSLADLPVTAELPGGLTVVIVESDRLHYPRLMLQSVAEDPDTLRTWLMRYPGRADGFYVTGEANAAPTFTVSAGFATPWRAIVIGTSPSAVIEHSGLVTALARHAVFSDTSWIKPGRAMRIMTRTTEAGLACIDFAARHKLEYVMYDAHWYGDGKDESDATVPIPAIDIHRVIDYGRQRSVGLIVYVDREPVRRQLDAMLDTYQQWGIAGIKFGFILEGRQEDSDFIFTLIRKCAERRIFVNLHDNLRPAGLERTLPNYLTLEGVRGNEQFPSARHNVTLPFVRNVGGPMDYTICYAAPRSQTTNAHQLAMSAVYYSPLNLLYWYDQPAKYAQGQWPELSWFDECPTSWDETRALSGVIGEYVVVARRSNARWFLGVMTNETGRTLELPLQFLGKGAWTAHIYADGPPATRARETPVVMSRKQLHAGMTLRLVLAPAGGQAIRFERG